MTKERMLELLLLEAYEVIGETNDYLSMMVQGEFDYDKFNGQLEELRKEFLSPYVIDNAPSGE